MIQVTLHSNGNYWQGAWYDGNERVAKSLGSKAAMTRKAAEDRCFELSVELNKKARKAAPKSSGAWTYVSDATLRQVLAVCPNESWRRLFALCRWAGLRSGEARRLCWEHIDLERRLISVMPTTEHRTTKQNFRMVPICPELWELLAGGGTGRVCYDLTHNIPRDATEYIRMAGLKPWDKPLHTLRKSRQSDWLGKFPVLDVCSWMGNSPDVCREHYHQTLDTTVARVTGLCPADEVCALA